MNTNKNVGLIDFSSSEQISNINTANNFNEYTVKKIMKANKKQGDIALPQFPEAQFVNDAKSIIDDSAIDLILVSKPKQADLAIVGEAVQAGKNVRII